MTLSPKAVEAAARAIIKARQEWRDREGPFGVYYLPYSVAGQHAVRDFRPGAEAKIVSRFDTHEEAMAECALLTEQHFLAAALAVDGLCLVPKEPTAKMIAAAFPTEGERSPPDDMKIGAEAILILEGGRDCGSITGPAVIEAASMCKDYRAMLAAASDGDPPRKTEG